MFMRDGKSEPDFEGRPRVVRAKTRIRRPVIWRSPERSSIKATQSPPGCSRLGFYVPWYFPDNILIATGIERKSLRRSPQQRQDAAQACAGACEHSGKSDRRPPLHIQSGVTRGFLEGECLGRQVHILRSQQTCFASTSN